MVSKEIIAVYIENDTKPIKNFCGKNAELLNVKAGVHTDTTVFQRDVCGRLSTLISVPRYAES
jgi:hypothetical protein